MMVQMISQQNTLFTFFFFQYFLYLFNMEWHDLRYLKIKISDLPIKLGTNQKKQKKSKKSERLKISSVTG